MLIWITFRLQHNCAYLNKYQIYIIFFIIIHKTKLKVPVQVSSLLGNGTPQDAVQQTDMLWNQRARLHITPKWHFPLGEQNKENRGLQDIILPSWFWPIITLIFLDSNYWGTTKSSYSSDSLGAQHEQSKVTIWHIHPPFFRFGFISAMGWTHITIT